MVWAVIYFSDSGRALSHGTLDGGPILEGLLIPQFLCFAFPFFFFILYFLFVVNSVIH